MADVDVEAVQEALDRKWCPDDVVVDPSGWPFTLNMLIERARLSRAEFLRRINADSSQGYRWCVEGQKPSFDVLRKMATVLDCSADELLGLPARVS